MGGKKALGVAVALSALVLLPPHRLRERVPAVG